MKMKDRGACSCILAVPLIEISGSDRCVCMGACGCVFMVVGGWSVDKGVGVGICGGWREGGSFQRSYEAAIHITKRACTAFFRTTGQRSSNSHGRCKDLVCPIALACQIGMPAGCLASPALNPGSCQPESAKLASWKIQSFAGLTTQSIAALWEVTPKAYTLPSSLPVPRMT